MELEISETQNEWIQNSTADINIASGSIRSGKTFGQIWTLFNFLQGDECEKEIDILFIGKTGGTLERNILKDFFNLMEKLGKSQDFHYVKAPDKRIDYKPKNLSIHCVGGNDEGSESKVRGMTVQAIFGDELTLMPMSFVNQCFGRMSHGCQRAWFTTNPDSPEHWVYRNYMMNPDLDVKVFYFILTDNPSLTKKYKDRISAIYTGADYERFIEGKWIADSESLIIPEFWAHEEAIVKEMSIPTHYHKMVAMDVGFRDLTFLVFGYYDFARAKYIVQDELSLKNMLTEDLAYQIREKERDLWKVEHIGNHQYKDNVKVWGRFSDTDLIVINDLSVTYKVDFSPTMKDNKDVQINKLRMLVQSDRIEIHPRCEQLIRQLKTGIWDKNKKSFERSADDGHFDGIDALVYFVRNLPEYDNPFPGGFAYDENNEYVHKHIKEAGMNSRESEIIADALGL